MPVEGLEPSASCLEGIRAAIAPGGHSYSPEMPAGVGAVLLKLLCPSRTSGAGRSAARRLGPYAITASNSSKGPSVEDMPAALR